MDDVGYFPSDTPPPVVCRQLDLRGFVLFDTGENDLQRLVR